MPPSGAVTFLFTDIEGSTRRWESDADAMRSALAAHNKVLHSAIEDHGGFVFSHSGDDVAAAFASPQSAVDAAIEAHSVGYRAGGIANDVDDRQRSTRSSGSSFSAAGRVTARAGTPPDIAPRGVVVL